MSWSNTPVNQPKSLIFDNLTSIPAEGIDTNLILQKYSEQSIQTNSIQFLLQSSGKGIYVITPFIHEGLRKAIVVDMKMYNEETMGNTLFAELLNHSTGYILQEEKVALEFLLKKIRSINPFINRISVEIGTNHSKQNLIIGEK